VYGGPKCCSSFLETVCIHISVWNITFLCSVDTPVIVIQLDVLLLQLKFVNCLYLYHNIIIFIQFVSHLHFSKVTVAFYCNCLSCDELYLYLEFYVLNFLFLIYSIV
jgi:hypothetical protein